VLVMPTFRAMRAFIVDPLFRFNIQRRAAWL
jgi:hypothetical protein